MTWLTWRQFRMPALSVLAGLVAIAVVLAITGPGLVGRTDFSDEDVLFSGTILALYLLPAVIGVFWGVPMITRELETGTHSLVWNQTVTRKRWLTTKLGFGLLAAMLAAAVLSVAVSWWASPIDALSAQQTDRGMLSRIAPVVFGARGIAPIGYAAFALALGVAVGMLLKRTVAAMAVTLATLAAVLLLVPLFVRPYLLPPQTEVVAITGENITNISGDDTHGILEIGVRKPAGAWELANETLDPAGNVADPLPEFVQACAPRPGAGPPPQGSMETCMGQLGAHGYQQRVTYQPGSRFWPLQWLELALYLAMTALLTWFCFRRLRHLS
ncbi:MULTISPECIES: transporter [unclassified Amycolatopsis]|uniref:transporter n=1 Tax=unclassified Amycolatopsis TaxID=2618356 RepID=UPI0028741AB9|nr:MULTISPECIES: transporter [unclassified Amycolatopsis]MDS0132219.1 transporter [Amycolatopsis sp. 505]MDS0141043.1 transporter [Amycolatopsis sp. CM201R]